MAFQHFIPELWSAAILEQLTNGAILTSIANREYEGDFAKGNKVHIPGITPVKVKDYKGAGRTTTPDDVTDTGVELSIDQEKSFDFKVQDIDRIQGVPGMLGAFAKSAKDGLLEDVETHLSTILLAGDSSPISESAPTDYAGAYTKLLKLRSELTKKKVGLGNRIALVNSSFETLLLGADGKLASVDTSGDSDGLREATIGRLAGFRVIVSPYLEDEKPTAIGFAPETLAYVSQINELEAMRAQDSFSDRMRGLHVYGAKVIRPEMVRVFKAS